MPEFFQGIFHEANFGVARTHRLAPEALHNLAGAAETSPPRSDEAFTGVVGLCHPRYDSKSDPTIHHTPLCSHYANLRFYDYYLMKAAVRVAPAPSQPSPGLPGLQQDSFPYSHHSQAGDHSVYSAGGDHAPAIIQTFLPGVVYLTASQTCS